MPIVINRPLIGADFGTVGPIQCSSCATADWKGCEGVPKVLDDKGQGSEGARSFR